MNSEQLIDAIGNIDDELIINAKTKKRRFGIVRKLTIAVAILFCVTMPLPVMEVFGSETAYSMMYMVSPEIAQKFKPVQKSCTCQRYSVGNRNISCIIRNKTFYIFPLWFLSVP